MRYNIVIVANEDYIQHAAVMLCSLFETNNDKQFDIYLLTDQISQATQKRLHALCLKYNSTLFVKEPEKELDTALNINLKELPTGQWNTMMYYKLFMPVMLPKECDRCLFLDVDMIINDDIDQLYNWNLDNAVIAAAEDIPDCIKIKDRLKLKQSDKYINSGVMVCDLKSWRKLEEKVPIFKFVKDVANIIVNEQDVIALYFKEKLTFLPIRWNMTTFYFLREPLIFDKYRTGLKQAQYFPGIIHFSAPIKPWFKDCLHPYRKKYRQFLAISNWPSGTAQYYKRLSSLGRFRYNIYRILNVLNIKSDPFYPCLMK